MDFTVKFAQYERISYSAVDSIEFAVYSNLDLRNEIWRYLPLTTRKILGLVCKRYYRLLTPEARVIPVFDMAIAESKGDAYTCFTANGKLTDLHIILTALHKVGWSPGLEGEGFHTLLSSLQKTNLVLNQVNLERFLLLSEIGFRPTETTFQFAVQKDYFGLLFYLYYRHPSRTLHKNFYKNFYQVNFTHLAAWCNQPTLIKLLASNNKQSPKLVKVDLDTLLFALKAGNQEVIKSFLSSKTGFIISYAAKHGQLDLLERVETACFSSWEVQYSGIAHCKAIKHNRVDVLEWLHSRGSTWGRETYLYKEAIKYGQLEPLVWLVEHGYHYNAEECFHGAIRNGHVHILDWLKGLPSNRCFNFQQTLNSKLLWEQATREGNLKVLKWLVANNYPEKYQTVKNSRYTNVQEWMEGTFRI